MAAASNSLVPQVVRFLVSPHSGFLTGEVIGINGGLHLN